jgi:WD40 repeat protein
MLSALSMLVLAAGGKPQTAAKPIYDVEVAPNDEWMAVSASSDDIWIYSLDGKLLRTLHHKKGSHLVDIEISPDGQSMVCTNQSLEGDYCPVWSTETWKETAKVGTWVTPTFCNAPASVEFAGDGKYLVGTTTFNHDIGCWDAKTGELAYMAKKTKVVLFSFAVHAKSSLVVLNEGSAPGLRFWDFLNAPESKEWGSSIRGFDLRALRNMKFSHDQKQLFVLLQPLKTYCLFNLYVPKNGKASLKVQDQITKLTPRDMAWSGDDTQVWVCGMDGQILCFDPKWGSLRRHWTGHGGATVRALATTYRGHTVITTSDRTVCVWNGDTGDLMHSFKIPASS